MDTLIRCFLAAVAALTGAAAAYGFVQMRYRIALAAVRRTYPDARLCRYDFDAMAIWLVPLGAACTIVLAEVLWERYGRWRASRAAIAAAARRGEE
jgi:hypothetical protein